MFFREPISASIFLLLKPQVLFKIWLILIDLEQVVVITGFAEVGSWGSSRTRWEMEAREEFTIEGCIEMAWIMGFIKHFDGRLKDGLLYVGWVDSKTNEPVDDKDCVEVYTLSLKEKTKLKGLIEDSKLFLPLQSLKLFLYAATRTRYFISFTIVYMSNWILADFETPHFKMFLPVPLQAHFSCLQLLPDLAPNQILVLEKVLGVYIRKT
jgi:uncharacterized membrane protein YhdT